MSDEQGRVRRALAGQRTEAVHDRVVPLDDIEILGRAKGGDGRTVTAYAAVFDTPVPIADQDGEYTEQIARNAFDKSIAERGTRIVPFYHHARTLHGAPSELGSVPLGKTLDIRPDGRGLLTTARYNKTDLAEQVLESIRNGDITGQSFSGAFLLSDPGPGPYFSRADGQPQLVTRQEIALLEYGPTPIPAYAAAEIVGVRAAGDNSGDGSGDQGNITTPNAADLNAAARKYAASQGWAMPDGSYPIRPANMHGQADLDSAISAVGRGSGSHDSIRAHIVKRAKAIGMPERIPDNWPGGGSSSSTGGNSGLSSTGVTSGGSSSGRAEQTRQTITISDPAPAEAAAEPAAISTGDRSTEAEPVASTNTEEPTEPREHSRATTPKGKKMDDRMTVEERTARQSEIRARLSEIDTEYSGAALPVDVQTEWDTLSTEHDEHDTAIRAATDRAERIRALAVNQGATERVDNSRAGYGRQAPNVAVQPENIYDLTAVRQQARSIDELPGLYRDRAMRAIEQARFPGTEDRQGAQTRASHLLNSIDDDEGTLARRMLVTGSPLYERAFAKVIGSQSMAGLTGEESRALSLGADASGGYAVPFQLDPSIMLTSDGSVNPLRQVARVEQITGKKWQGVTSAGVQVTRGAEASEAGDNSPTLGQPEVETTRVQGFIPFSRELETGWNALQSELTMLLQDARDQEEATSFVNGDGTGENPFGLVATLPAGRQVAASGTATLTVPDDVHAVEESLPPRFRQRASWLANKSIYNMIRSAAAQNAGYSGDLWVRLSAGQPPELIGYPARELSTMTGTFSTVVGTANLVLMFGDYKRAFLIVDRVGMNIELIPHLFGANGRPTGQRGLYAVWFNSSKILVDNALRILKVTS